MANYKDYELLNDSLIRMGQTFRQARQDKLENELRNKSLDIAEGRNKIADQHYTEQNKMAQKRLDEGETEAWLTGEDGGMVQYKGSPVGLQQLQEQAQQRGKPLRITSAPGKRPTIGSFRTTTPLGELTFQMDSPDQVDTVLGMAKKIGGSAQKPVSLTQVPGGSLTPNGAFVPSQTGRLSDLQKAQLAPLQKRLAVYQAGIDQQEAGVKNENGETITDMGALNVYKSKRDETQRAIDAILAQTQQGHAPMPEVPGPGLGGPTAAPGGVAPVPVPVPGSVPAGAPTGAPMPVPQAAAPTRRADGKIHVMSPSGQEGWSSSSPQELQAAGYKIIP